MRQIKIIFVDDHCEYHEDINSAEDALFLLESEDVKSIEEVSVRKGKKDKFVQNYVAIWDFDGYGSVELRVTGE
jgi:hypothetical protein